MKRTERILACTTGTALLLAAAAVAQVREAGDGTGGRYTAQSRPRVAVLEFEDANTGASKERYGPSVEAMLVTFLQRKSQLAVVERQKLGGLYEEKRRIQKGMVYVPPGDTAARELLEKIDVYVLGTVTLLDGSRIEIDAKLFTRFDGRVVAAAQRSGPVTCLRSVVERLGAALEQDFLRPYYGKLQIQLTTPENVRIFLTPIPRDSAPDEERAPAERSSTVTIGDEYDTVESWITDPASYTVDHLLSGWYSLRLERPGYEDLKTDPGRWEVRDRAGRQEVYDRLIQRLLEDTDPELRRFVVHVDPLTTELIDGDALGFILRKKGGSLAPRVKRKYLDTGYTRVPQTVMLMGGKGLDLNRSEGSKEPGEDQECALFREKPLVRPDPGRTYVPVGQKFDFDKFKGGELIIEDYKGETVPAGSYQMVLWDLNYQWAKVGATVLDRTFGKVTQNDLARETLTLKLNVPAARPGSRVILKGRDTHHQLAQPLDFSGIKEIRGLPVDTYRVSTNIPGLEKWKRSFVLPSSVSASPRYYTRSSAYDPKVDRPPEEGRKPVLTVKTGFVAAGRTEVLSRPLDRQAGDLSVDRELGTMLDRLLYAQEPQGADEIRQLLAQRLELVDLLVLNPRDMARLRRSPEVAAIVKDYVKAGGALFAFVSETGDYGEVAGAPLVVETVSKLTGRFDLAPGEVAGIIPRFDRNVDIPSKRALPEISTLSQGSWRVIAFSQRRQGPRILERGQREDGGYVALWLDDPASFRDRQGRTIPKVEEIRGKVAERVLRWARYLMYRRYDKTGKQLRRAEQALAR
jgi:TolB-like protein